MSEHEFLQRFADLRDDQLHTLRLSNRLEMWEKDPRFYVELAQRCFLGSSENFVERQRIVSIFREMLYTDGRSLHALLWIAEQARKSPDLYGGDGMNSLAAISCYLIHVQLDEVSKINMRTWLTPFRNEKKYLANNAEQCLRAIDAMPTTIGPVE